jgi:hypothetical protein
VGFGMATAEAGFRQRREKRWVTFK